MITTVSLVIETSECCIGTDVDKEEVASPILRKPWKSVKKSACRRTALYGGSPIAGMAHTILCSSPRVMGRQISPLSSGLVYLAFYEDKKWLSPRIVGWKRRGLSCEGMTGIGVC